jgi:hypothetical protein
MRKFIIEVLDTAEQITPEKAFYILTFAFRGEVLSVQESRPTPVAADASPQSSCQHKWYRDPGDIASYAVCVKCGARR